MLICYVSIYDEAFCRTSAGAAKAHALCTAMCVLFSCFSALLFCIVYSYVPFPYIAVKYNEASLNKHDSCRRLAEEKLKQVRRGCCDATRSFV